MMKNENVLLDPDSEALWGWGANFGSADIFTAIVTINHPLFGLVHSELVKIQNGEQCTNNIGNINHTLLPSWILMEELVMF